MRHGFGKTGFIILFTLFIFPAMLSAQNSIMPDILDRRDFNCDFGYFTDRAIENLDRYSPGWDRDYPSTSPAIATVDYMVTGDTEKIVIVLFSGTEKGFANVIFLVESKEADGEIAILDKLEIVETLLIDFSLETDASYFESRIPQLLQSYHLYDQYRDQINRDMKT